MAQYEKIPPQPSHLSPPKQSRNTIPQPVHLLIYRADHSVYFKRLSASQYTILHKLAAGRTLAESLAPLESAAQTASANPISLTPQKPAAKPPTADPAEDLRALFILCASLRLLCPARK